MNKETILMLLVAVSGFAQDRQQSIQDLKLLIGKLVVAQRAGLCQPGTLAPVLTYAGKQGKVVSLKPFKFPVPMTESVLNRLTPEQRAEMEDLGKAATILVEFDDGVKLDSCGPIGPSRLSDYFELASGETLSSTPVSAASGAPAASASSSLVSSPKTIGQPANSLSAAVPEDVQSLSDGFYYKTPAGWQKLEQLSMAGGGLKHVGKMFVPGLTPQMVWTFRDPESPVQIDDKRPTFCIKELPALAEIEGRSRRDLLIVRFDKKKDHRELQTSNGGNMFTYKGGLSTDRMPDITTKTIADGIFMVTPNEDLRAGEYMITFSALGDTGYDFGIKK